MHLRATVSSEASQYTSVFLRLARKQWFYLLASSPPNLYLHTLATLRATTVPHVRSTGLYVLLRTKFERTGCPTGQGYAPLQECRPLVGNRHQIPRHAG